MSKSRLEPATSAGEAKARRETAMSAANATDSAITNDVLAAGADHALQAKADLTPAQAPKPPRDKAQSFRKLRDRRLSKAVKVISYLIPLSNKNAYAYTEAQAAEIVEVLREALADVQRAFAGTRSAKIVRQFL